MNAISKGNMFMKFFLQKTKTILSWALHATVKNQQRDHFIIKRKKRGVDKKENKNIK